MKGIMNLLLIAMLAVVNPGSTDQEQVYYLVPHQDDEILSMGVAILNDLDADKDVHVTLLTDGSASGVINRISDKLGRELSREEFSEARTREFKASLQAFGVNERNIRIEGYRDGELTESDVEEVIEDILAKHPEATFKTMSYLDNHNDHEVAGKAVLEAYESRKIRKAKFYLKPSQFGTELQDDWQAEKLKEEYLPRIEKAVESYNRWDLSEGFYAVGYTSVPKSFNQTINNPISFYHD